MHNCFDYHKGHVKVICSTTRKPTIRRCESASSFDTVCRRLFASCLLALAWYNSIPFPSILVARFRGFCQGFSRDPDTSALPGYGIEQRCCYFPRGLRNKVWPATAAPRTVKRRRLQGAMVGVRNSCRTFGRVAGKGWQQLGAKRRTTFDTHVTSCVFLC